MVYESLSFYTNQYGSAGKVDISYRIGAGSEVFVTQGLVPTTGNAAVTKKTIDFTDFSSTEEVTWTFYLYAASASNYGTRFDDITLFGYPDTGTVGSDPTKGFFKVQLGN